MDNNIKQTSIKMAMFECFWHIPRNFDILNRLGPGVRDDVAALTI